MKILHSLTVVAVVVALGLPAAAQNTPRGVAKQAKADRQMDRAHTLKHGESLRKEPRLVREEDRLEHRKTKTRR